MIPNHPDFLEALAEKHKVRVSFYSKADSGVLDRICAPMDYGPNDRAPDDLHRYWLWDYASNQATHVVGLMPQQIVRLQVLGEDFDPTEFGDAAWAWSVPRTWALTT